LHLFFEFGVEEPVDGDVCIAKFHPIEDLDEDEFASTCVSFFNFHGIDMILSTSILAETN